jgi:hypothetical protein
MKIRGAAYVRTRVQKKCDRLCGLVVRVPG